MPEARPVPDAIPLVDEATNPHLSGRFAPVGRELAVDDLEVELGALRRRRTPVARGS